MNDTKIAVKSEESGRGIKAIRLLHNTSISLNYSNFEPQSKYTHTIIFSHLNIQNDYLNSNRRGMTERKRKIKTEHTKERKLAHKLKKQSKAKQKFHHNINFN